MNNKNINAYFFYLKKQRIENIKLLLNKKNLIITILGYGLTGKSFLNWSLNNLHQSTKYYIIDKNINQKSLDNNNKKITYLNESYKNKCFKKSNFILPSPGFLIQQSKKYYWKIIPELDLFFYLWNNLKFEIILVTGSIGKSSLVTMINHYLSKSYNTILCGNIGYPVLNFLNNKIINNKKVIAIIECSNLQLKHCVLINPKYFILINLFKNHLDVHTSYKEYILSKLSPIIFQLKFIKKIIISQNTYNELNYFFPHLLKNILEKIILISNIKENYTINENIVYLKNNAIIQNNKILISNIPQFSFVLNWQISATILNFYFDNINEIIENNELPLLPEFRLQKINTNNKLITIFNDSKSTIIESSINALNQILITNKDTYIFFIIGGLSKGVSRINGIIKILKQVNQLILFGNEAQILEQNILIQLNKKEHKNIASFLDLLNATKYTIKKAKLLNKQSIIIFSPGGSSFDEFTSFIDRGNKFNEIINKIL